MTNINWPGILKGPQEVIAAPQDFTAAWIDIGDEQFVQGARFLVLWLELTINGSANMRIRTLAKLTEDAALEYNLPIETGAAAVVTVLPRYVEFADDADQDIVIGLELAGAGPWIQFQIQVGAVGVLAATVDSFQVTAVF